MDSSITYDIITAIRSMQKQNIFSIVLSVHQPTPRISELFDHALILDNREGVFFGTMSELQMFTNRISSRHTIFSADMQPLDYFLHAIRTDRSDDILMQYSDLFMNDELFPTLIKAMDGCPGDAAGQRLVVNRLGFDAGATSERNSAGAAEPVLSINLACFVKNLLCLTGRNLVHGFRDLSFFTIQITTLLAAGILSGLIFLSPPTVIGREIYVTLPGISLIPNLMFYIIVVKLKQAFDNKVICYQESSQRIYSIFTFWLAEVIANSIMLISFLPGVIIPYFLIGWPLASFPFVLMVSYTVSPPLPLPHLLTVNYGALYSLLM